MEARPQCPYCGGNITSTDYFCPHCGKKLKEKPLSTELSKQMMIYLLSFFLAPLGLWPAVKYLKQSDKKAKNIGLIAVGLTVISIVISVLVGSKFIMVFNKDITSRSEIYQNLGL